MHPLTPLFLPPSPSSLPLPPLPPAPACTYRPWPSRRGCGLPRPPRFLLGLPPPAPPRRAIPRSVCARGKTSPCGGQNCKERVQPRTSGPGGHARGASPLWRPCPGEGRGAPLVVPPPSAIGSKTSRAGGQKFEGACSRGRADPSARTRRAARECFPWRGARAPLGVDRPSALALRLRPPRGAPGRPRRGGADEPAPGRVQCRAAGAGGLCGLPFVGAAGAGAVRRQT